MLSLAVCMIYFIMLAVTAFLEYRDADFSEKIYLPAILFLALGGVFVQVFIRGVRSMWVTTAVSLLYQFLMGGKYISQVIRVIAKRCLLRQMAGCMK